MNDWYKITANNVRLNQYIMKSIGFYFLCKNAKLILIITNVQVHVEYLYSHSSLYYILRRRSVHFERNHCYFLSFLFNYTTEHSLMRTTEYRCNNSVMANYINWAIVEEYLSLVKRLNQ